MKLAIFTKYHEASRISFMHKRFGLEVLPRKNTMSKIGIPRAQ
jgi:hypothetical protein